MKYRQLGRTGLQVSEIGFGAWAIGGNSYGRTDDCQSLRALGYALDHGVNFIDTADIYGEGHSEKLVGEAVAKNRDKVIIATKVGWDFYHPPAKKSFDPGYIRFAAEESLKRLKTDYIDLYQLHNPDEDEIKNGAFSAILEDLKREGKIRYYGISIHNVAEGKAVLDHERGDVIQAIINLMDQRAIPDLLPEAKKKNVGMIAREPLNCGMLSGKYDGITKFPKGDHRRRWKSDKLAHDTEKLQQIRSALKESSAGLVQAALEFILAQDGVSVVIPGAKTAGQVEEHLRASEHPKLTLKEHEALLELSGTELFQSGFFHN